MKQPAISSVFNSLLKLDARLWAMHRFGVMETLPFRTRKTLFKRYKRYLKKLLKPGDPVAKALGIFAISMLLYSRTEAQGSCKIFKDAIENNPLRRIPPVNNLLSPTLVDIDGDGDLDCYGIYRVPDVQYNSYDSVRFSFIKNVGTPTLPIFEPAGTGGLPTTPDVFYGYFAQEGPVFADIDGDGDYDCFLGNFPSYGGYRITVEYFENIGDKHNPVFVQRPRDQNPLSFVNGYRGLLFNLVDMDGDGDYDLFTFESYYDKFYLNKGTKNNPDFVFIRDDRQPGFGNKYFNYYNFIHWNTDTLIDIIPVGGGVFYTYTGPSDEHHFITQNFKDAPKFTGNVRASAMADLNNDGFYEIIGSNLGYATTSPVVTIQASGNTRLDAYPKGPYTYQWLKDRAIIKNATNDFIEVAEPGEYIATVTGNCGTGISLPYNVTVNIAVASLPAKENLSASTKAAHLQLYPNPFTAECVLQFDESIVNKITVHVTDAQGRLIASLNVTGNTLRFGKELKPGIYFVQAIQDNKIIFSQKLIKQ